MKPLYLFKLMILVVAISLNGKFAKAQSACYSFDDFTVATNNLQHAFNTYGNGNSGFLQDWRVTSGTPSILNASNSLNVTPYNGTQFASMAICDADTQWTEGLSLQSSFTQGNAYNISMAICNTRGAQSPTPIEVEYYLLPNAISYTYNSSTGCSPTPPVPAGALKVHTVSNFDQNSWQVVSFNTGGLQANYTQLWIRLKFSAGGTPPTTYFCMDSVCIDETPSQNACYSFDEEAISLNDQQQAFNVYGNGNPGFLEDWEVASGTPSVLANGNSLNVTAYSGTQFALMAICNAGADWSEGVSLKFNFAQGKAYNVSMAVLNTRGNSTPTPIEVEYYLLPSAINYTYNSNTGCSQTAAVPNGALLVSSVANLASNNWQVISFNTGSLNTTYSRLWIRLKFSAGGTPPTTYFCMDSVCVSDSRVTGISDLTISRKETTEPQLSQNNQNPFSGETSIHYFIPEENGSTANSLEVYSITGELVKQYSLTNSGYGSVIFNGSNLNAGVYLYSLVVNGQRIETRRMLVAR